MTKPCSETHHRDTRHLVPVPPPVGCFVSRTVLGGKGSLRRDQLRRALASCAPFRKPDHVATGGSIREPDVERFLRLAKNENRVVVDKISYGERPMMSVRTLLVALALAAAANGQSPAPLQEVASIPLPGVRGRIDHLSIDLKSRRLFVAALGNNTVEVIDLNRNVRLHPITGLDEPQGVLYVPDANRLYVANDGDGSLRIFDGSSFKLLKTISYGDDADNLRYDAGQKRVYVGYGGGAIGAIDPDGSKVENIKLNAHPESFQIDDAAHRIYVNLPNARKISIIDLAKGSVVASWRTDGALGNFPMALDQADHRLFVVCRYPARLLVLDTTSGKVVAIMPSVGDSDDVFYDRARKRIYATGGAGAIWVYRQRDPDHYQEIARIPTVEGARTSLFSPELGRLFVAVRTHGRHPAEIRVYKVK